MRLSDSRRGGWGGAALASAALVAYAATAALVPLDNNDIWIHLTTGGLILDEGAVPRTDRYSFTAAGNRYVAHEWLAAVLYATAERAAGIPGVVVAAKLLPTLAIATTPSVTRITGARARTVRCFCPATSVGGNRRELGEMLDRPAGNLGNRPTEFRCRSVPLPGPAGQGSAHNMLELRRESCLRKSLFQRHGPFRKPFDQGLLRGSAGEGKAHLEITADVNNQTGPFQLILLTFLNKHQRPVCIL